MITDNLVGKQTVIDALERTIREESMSAIRVYWDMYTSPDQKQEFNDSYVLFESCVRRRYNLMTGGTL